MMTTKIAVKEVILSSNIQPYPLFYDDSRHGMVDQLFRTFPLYIY